METAFPVMFFDKIKKVIIDSSSVRKPKCRTGTEIMEHDEFLLNHNATMITLLSLWNKEKDIGLEKIDSADVTQVWVKSNNVPSQRKESSDKSLIHIDPHCTLTHIR
jgi:hypothetical protein